MNVGQRLRRALCVVLAAAASSGCFVFGAGDCSDEPARCDGSAVLHCVPPCSDIGCTKTWEREECSVTCVNLQGGGPTCALSQTPDPGCKDVDFFCDGAHIVTCFDGFAIRREDCPENTECVATDLGRPLCAVGGAADPRCSSADMTSHCEGKTALTCELGFATAVTECPDACAPLWGGAGCAVSNTPDPHCAIEITHSLDFTYCDGPILIKCNNGFQVERKNCSCVEQGGIPVCEAPDGG